MATRLVPYTSLHNTQSGPHFFPDAGLWVYGNSHLLGAALASIPRAFGPPSHNHSDLDLIEREAEKAVLGGKTLVTGIHSPAQQGVAIVPLRWGSPRILVLSGGISYHLGPTLKEEPFRAARLWRYQFDESTDLVISRRAPEKLPTFARFNPTIDRLIDRIVTHQIPGLLVERLL